MKHRGKRHAVQQILIVDEEQVFSGLEESDLAYDQDTALYNSDFWNCLLRRKMEIRLLPISILLCQYEGENIQHLPILAKALQDIAEPPMILARADEAAIGVYMAQQKESRAYCFAERLAGKLEQLGQRDQMTVSIVIKEITSPLESLEEAYQKATDDLAAGRKINLKYIVPR